MGGVDLSDQKIKYYAIDRKSKRNWIRIFLHFLNASWINSFTYYKNLSRSNISTVEYISSVSTALIGNCSIRKRLGRPLAITNQKRMRIEGSISDSVSSEQGRKSETSELQRTRCTPKQYRRFSRKFFSDFNTSVSPGFGTVIGVQPA